MFPGSDLLTVDDASISATPSVTSTLESRLEVLVLFTSTVLGSLSLPLFASCLYYKYQKSKKGEQSIEKTLKITLTFWLE